MQSTENPNTLAVATDTRLAALDAEAAQVNQQLAYAITRVHNAAGDKQDWRNRRAVWRMTDEEACTATPQPWNAKDHAAALADIEAANQRLTAIHDETVQLNQVWVDNGGWSRFFLVPDGHIHRSMLCSTCNRNGQLTGFAWLPRLSGLTEADAVAAHGAILCTVCFPSAPVEWTNETPGQREKEARKAEREAAKAERERKRLEKALLPDGTALEVGFSRLATLTTAKSWLTDAFQWNAGRAEADFHPSFTADMVERVAEAVAAKTGESVEDVKAAAAKRAAKRR